MLHTACKGHFLERADEVPVILSGIEVADDVDLARVAAAEAALVGKPHEFYVAQRIEPHELCGDCIDGHLVGGGKQDILNIRDHAPRTRTVTGKRAVHDRKDPAMDLLLDHEQVDERLVDACMGPVAVLVQQPAEGIFHGPGRCGKNMGLDCRQVDDVLADEAFRDQNPFG